MAETFDSLGRIVGRSVEDIKADIDASVNRVVQASGQNATQIGRLTDLVDRLQGIVKNTKDSDNKVREKLEPSMVRVDPRDLAVFQAAAAAFEKASESIQRAADAREKPVKKEYKGGLSEQALDAIGRKLDNISKAVSGENLISAAEKMLDSLSRKTLNVQDAGLAKTAAQIYDHLNKRDITAPKASHEIAKEKIPNGFYSSLNRLVKAGLTKGSVYTHDFAAESLLTEMMNDMKLAVIALREIAANSGVSKTGNADLTRLFSEDLRSRRLDTLQKKSIVTDEVFNKFQNRRSRVGGGGGGGGLPPGIGPVPGSLGSDPASTFELDGDVAGLNSAAQELAKALKSANLGLWAKEFAQAFGTSPKSLDAAMVGLLDKIINSGQLSADDLEIAARSANQAEFMDANDRRQIKILVDELNKAAIELANARTNGSGNIEQAEKEFQDKYVQVLSGLIKSYKNLDGSLANFEKKVRDVSYALYDMQRVVGLLKPSNYGIGPEVKFGDPKGMLREFGTSASDWTKKIAFATNEAFGTTGNVMSKNANELDRMFLDAGMNLEVIYKQTGLVAEEFRGIFLNNFKKGITDLNTLNKVTKLGGTLGKAIGANAEQTAEEFADWNMQLGLSTDELEIVARRTIQIGKVTGVTGDNLLQAVKASKQFAENMRNAATLTAEAASRFTQISASSKKMGVESQTSKLLEGLSGTVPFLTKVNDQTRAFMAQAAMRSGTMQKLMNGTLMQDKDALKSFVGGMEQLFQLFSGGLNLDQLDKLSPDQLAKLNLQLEAATGMQVGEFKKVVDAFKEGTMTAADKLAEVEKNLAGVLTKSDRATMEAQKKQLALQVSQESFDAQLMKGGKAYERIKQDSRAGLNNSKQILMEEFGGVAGIQQYGQALLKEVENYAKNSGTDLNDKSIVDLRRLVDNLNKGQIDTEDFLSVIDAAKTTMGGLNKVQPKAGTSDFAELEYKTTLQNLKLQQKIEGYWQQLLKTVTPEGMLRIENAQAILSAATSVVNELQIISQGLVGLAALKFVGGGLFGKGATAATIGKAGKAAPVAGGIAAAGPGIKGGVPGIKSAGTGLVPTPAGIAKGAKGVGVPVAAAEGAGAIKGAGMLGKFGKVLGPLGKVAGPLALLDLVFGGMAGFQESGGKIGDTIMGVLTGGSKTGSFLSKHVGIEEGSAGDKALGVAGAAGRGAMIGMIFGPWGAAIGAVIGGIAELIKVFGGLDPLIEKISTAFSTLGSGLKRSFGPVMDNVRLMFQNWVDMFSKIAKNLGDMFGSLGLGNGGFLDSLLGMSAGMMAGGPMGAFAGAIVGFDNLMKALGVVGSFVATLANSIIYTFGVVQTFLTEAWGFISDIAKDVWGAFKDIIKSIGGEGFMNKLIEFFQGFRKAIGDFLDRTKSFIDNMNEYMDLAFIKRNFADFFNFLRIKFNEMLDFGEGFFDVMTVGFAIIKDSFNTIINSVITMINGVIGAIKGIYDKVQEVTKSDLFPGAALPDWNVGTIGNVGNTNNVEQKMKEIAERNSKRGNKSRADNVRDEIKQREESKLYNPQTQLQGSMDAVREVTTKKELKNMNFDTHLSQGAGVTPNKFEDLVKEFKGETEVKKADTKVWFGERDKDNKGIIRDTGITFGGKKLKEGEALQYYTQMKDFLTSKWHAGWALYSKGVNSGNANDAEQGKLLMKEAGSSMLILDMAYQEATGSSPPKPATVPDVASGAPPGGTPGGPAAPGAMPDVKNPPTPAKPPGEIKIPTPPGGVGTPGAPGMMPGNPSILNSTDGLPFRAPKGEKEIADVAAMNKLAMDIAPIFHKATKDKMVNLRTLDIIAADVFGQLKGKKAFTEKDYQDAVKGAFKRHLNVDITDPATFTPIPGLDKISQVEKTAIDAATAGALGAAGGATSTPRGTAVTAPPNPLDEAGRAIQKEKIAADTEKAKIEEGNAHLEEIEGNTQKTNEEIRKLTAAVQVLIGVMTAGGSSEGIRTSDIPPSRPIVGAPPNYYAANMSPNNQAGMGGTLPRT